MPDHDNDIAALLVLLHDGGWKDFHRALTALVAERDSLKQRVEELEAREAELLDSNAELHRRLNRIMASPIPFSPADPDRDLRERLLESALRGAARDAHMHHEASSMGTRAVYIVDAAIAAMRKGEA